MMDFIRVLLCTLLVIGIYILNLILWIAPRLLVLLLILWIIKLMFF